MLPSAIIPDAVPRRIGNEKRLVDIEFVDWPETGFWEARQIGTGKSDCRQRSFVTARAFPSTDLGQTSPTPVSGAAGPLRTQLTFRRRRPSTRFLYRL